MFSKFINPFKNQLDNEFLSLLDKIDKMEEKQRLDYKIFFGNAIKQAKEYKELKAKIKLLKLDLDLINERLARLEAKPKKRKYTKKPKEQRGNDVISMEAVPKGFVLTQEAMESLG